MSIKKIRDLRTPYKYFAVIKNGIDWRGFANIDICCELMRLDKKVLERHCEKFGYYTGYDFTVFRFQEENKTIHRNHYIS
jgi:hypothetical protein